MQRIPAYVNWLVPQKTSGAGTMDVSGIGAGGLWMITSVTYHNIVWHIEWPAEISKRVISVNINQGRPIDLWAGPWAQPSLLSTRTLLKSDRVDVFWIPQEQPNTGTGNSGASGGTPKMCVCRTIIRNYTQRNGYRRFVTYFIFLSSSRRRVHTEATVNQHQDHPVPFLWYRFQKWRYNCTAHSISTRNLGSHRHHFSIGK